MEKIVEIERSIIKNLRGKLWSPFIKALKEYQMLKKGDHVCVCISGGKDSMLLAKLFQELKKHSDFEFDVTYLVMNPGYNEYNLNKIKHNLELLEIPAEIIDTDIFEVANNIAPKNPCYMCAKMRRGALYNLAKQKGCNKLALGHHYDDVIETTLIALFHSGTIETMLPKLHSENYEGMEIIRPMYFIREKHIINWANNNDLNFIQCACRFTEENYRDDVETASKRYEIKQMIKKMEKENPLVIKNIFKATSNINLNKLIQWKKDGKTYNYLDDYDK